MLGLHATTSWTKYSGEAIGGVQSSEFATPPAQLPALAARPGVDVPLEEIRVAEFCLRWIAAREEKLTFPLKRDRPGFSLLMWPRLRAAGREWRAGEKRP